MVGGVECLFNIMHDGTVYDKEEVRGEWASLPYACGGSACGAVEACCLDFEKWVGIDLCYDVDALLLDAIAFE